MIGMRQVSSNSKCNGRFKGALDCLLTPAESGGGSFSLQASASSDGCCSRQQQRVAVDRCVQSKLSTQQAQTQPGDLGRVEVGTSMGYLKIGFLVIKQKYIRSSVMLFCRLLVCQRE
jgi:hypothetical protein